ncbi:hypothetical protein GW17_00005143 [Ensete ventricosum]|nr:hypothetical protein GW17_00005143 [Ensete ventricosum]
MDGMTEGGGTASRHEAKRRTNNRTVSGQMDSQRENEWGRGGAAVGVVVTVDLGSKSLPFPSLSLPVLVIKTGPEATGAVGYLLTTFKSLGFAATVREMGRATRWLRSLWGGKKESKDPKEFSRCSGGGEDRREKKRWSFGKPAKDAGEVVLGQNASTAAAVEAAWFRSFYAESDKEQSKHAIAVAAATAAAADAAVAAAHAAVAVVRLTTRGTGAALDSGRERWYAAAAAVKIQTSFRGYLVTETSSPWFPLRASLNPFWFAILQAKKALRALKALVKLQALVRGYLNSAIGDRWYALPTQAAAPCNNAVLLGSLSVCFWSQERFDDARSENMSSFHCRRLSSCLDNVSNSFDRSPKIVEVDTGRPRSRSSRRTTPSVIDPAEDSHWSSISSPLPPCQIPARISVPDCRDFFQDYDWCLAGEKCRQSATAQSTPRGVSSSSNWPVAGAKSVCDEDGVRRRFLLNVRSCHNYMASTESFEAKLRSQSAPKQRPDPAGTRKRVPLSEVTVESMAAALGGVGFQRPCSRAQEAFNFRSAVVGKIDKSSELRREAEEEIYLPRKW